jgi:O-acetylserine/cysteine efflux transporter
MIVAYDPKFGQEIIGLIFIIMMSFFYALSNVLSRFLKDIRIVDQIGWHSFIGFIFLLLLSFCLEGNFLNHIYPLNYIGMLVAFHAGFFVSLIGHGGLFYLYKFYPISIILPYYSLFPIFGIILTFLIFYEVPQIYEIIGGIVVIGSVYLMHKDNKNTKVLK